MEEKKIFENVTDLIKIQQAIVQPILDFQKNVQRPLTEFWLEQLRFHEAMVKVTRQAIFPIMSAVENLPTPAYIEQLFYDYGLILIEMGWPPVIDIGMKELSIIVNSYREEGLPPIREDIENHFINIYDSKRTKLLVQSWDNRNWLKKRMSILKDAIEAHCDGKYNLSIPAMLPQIEGIIFEGFGHIGFQYVDKYKKYLKRLLPVNQLDDKVARNFVLEILLQRFILGDPIPNNISRHAILHGADTSYGNKINSLKVILLFNYLQKELKYITLEKRKTIHKIHCPRILASKRKRIIFKSYDDAVSKGNSSCKICNPGKYNV